MWQSITTAPRDGTHILIWCDDFYYIVFYQKRERDKIINLRLYLTYCCWQFPYSDDDTCFSSEENPSDTYWQPLPTKPQL